MHRLRPTKNMQIETNVSHQKVAIMKAYPSFQLRSRNEWIMSRPERSAARLAPSLGPTTIGVSHFLPMLAILLAGIALTALACVPMEVAVWKAKERCYFFA